MKDAGTEGIQKWAQTFVVVVLAAALGVTVSLLMDARRRIASLEKTQAPATETARGEAPPADETLYDTVQDLRARVQTMEARLGVARGSPAGVAAAQRAAADLEDELAGLPPVGLGDGTGTDAVKLTDRRAELQALVKQELESASQARDEERNARAHARLVEKLDALEKTAKLNAEQKQKLTTMLDAEQQEIRQLFRDARDSGDFATIREQVRALRAHTDENALAVLEDDQKTAYANMREEERARFLGLGGAREER